LDGGANVRQRFTAEMGAATFDEAIQLWPTPQSWDGRRGAEDREAKRARGAGGINLQAAVGMFPTPDATDNKGPSSRSEGKERPTCDDDLPTRVGGQLNPEFVEYLMGFPKGWTNTGETANGPACPE